MEMRVGHGYDIHRLEAGRRFVAGGVAIDHPAGPVGHSDGDAVLHALTDAVLGAIGEGDIGQHFPDDDPANAGADSMRFLASAVQRMTSRGWRVANADVTIICEQPRIGPHRRAIAERLAGGLRCEIDRVNVKGKTHEGVDAVGEGRAIEVHAVVLLERDDGRRAPM